MYLSVVHRQVEEEKHALAMVEQAKAAGEHGLAEKLKKDFNESAKLLVNESIPFEAVLVA